MISGARNMMVRRPPATTSAGQHAAAISGAPRGPGALEVVGGAVMILGMYVGGVAYVMGAVIIAAVLPGLAVRPELGGPLVQPLTDHPWPSALLVASPVLTMLVGYVVMNVGQARGQGQ